MRNEASNYPGRIKLIPVPGSPDTYDTIDASQVTIEGTPLSKETLLTDPTEIALWGDTANRYPTDALTQVLNSARIFATCTTAANIGEKVATLATPGTFVRAVGTTVLVYFSLANTASNPTLSVGGTSAVFLRWNNANISPGMLQNGYYDIRWDGTFWQLLNPFPAPPAYGTCTTTAATIAKVATLPQAPGWKRVSGSLVTLSFSETNTAVSPTLNVASSGAASIIDARTNAAPSPGAIAAGVHTFMFNGTQWMLMDARTPPAVYYATSSTAAATIAKVATLTAPAATFVREVNALVTVSFTVVNTADNPTLNVANTGAGTIRWNNANISPGMLQIGTYDFRWDGTYWQLLNPYQLPTAYGTCTTAATTTAKVASLVNSLGWRLANGVIVAIKFTYTTTVASPTLNVASTGAFPFYDSRTNTYVRTTDITAGNTYLVMYNNAQWTLLNGDDRFVFGSYVGTGVGAPNAVTITFPATPRFVFITCVSASDTSEYSYQNWFCYGAGATWIQLGSARTTMYLTWTATSLSFGPYSTQSYPERYLNGAGFTYEYMLIY